MSSAWVDADHPDTRLPAHVANKIAPDESGCWLWGGEVDRGGYGRTTLRGKRHLAHRLVYQLLVGQIPEGLVIDHLCSVRHCVNPRHLEPVTPAENNRRCACVSTLNALKTHCPQGHPYDAENTLQYPGARVCRACQRLARIQRGEQAPDSVANKDKTHCKRGHEFTPENTRIEAGWRRCLTCKRETRKR